MICICICHIIKYIQPNRVSQFIKEARDFHNIGKNLALWEKYL